MKTLKLISLSFLFALFTLIATANSTIKNTFISSTDDLRQVIKEKVESYYAEPFNFLYKNGMNKLEENVEIYFFITPEKIISISSIKCQDPIAIDFVKQVLNREILNVDSQLTSRMYKIKIQLNYKEL